MEPYVGQVILYPIADVPPEERRVPSGWFVCDGQQRLPIAEYEGLFQLLGNRYGGDDDTFALPDLSKKAPRGLQYIMAAYGAFPL